MLTHAGHAPEGCPKGGSFLNNHSSPEGACLGLALGRGGKDLSKHGTPKLGASQEMRLLTLSRLAVKGLLPSPGASGSGGDRD